MSWTFLIYGMVPLIAFVIVDAYAGLKWAVISATGFAVLDILVTYYTTQRWDFGLVVAAALILGLGVWALRKSDAKLFKLQPVVLGVLLAVFVAYHQFFGTKLIDTYIPMIRELAPAETTAMLDDPRMVATLDKMVNGLVGVFLVHATLVWVAARRMGNVAWLVVRGVGFWVLLFLMAVVVAFMSAASA